MRNPDRHAQRGGFHPQRARLEEEIAILQRRLDQIGPYGDCGYEKALIRFFQDQIAIRRQRLATGAAGSLMN